MNNIFFCIVRYLRDRGINADLLLLDGEDNHFLPEADSYERCIQYIRKLKWRQRNFGTINSSEILNDLKEYDLTIGCGRVPAYLHRAGLKLDIFIPYGSDFYDLPFRKKKINSFQSFVKLFLFGQNRATELARHQLQGIINSNYIICEELNKESEEILKKFKYKGERLFFSAPMLYHSQYNYDVIQKYSSGCSHIDTIRKVREENDLVIFQQCRQSWNNSNDKFSLKGNNNLINGFKKFIDLQIVRKPHLVLLEYGSDVDQTKQLIAELGIADHVTWLPKMYRKDLMIALYHADIGVGALEHSWYLYGSIFEFMTLSKPFIHYRNDKLYPNKFLYPMLNARSADEVSEKLVYFCNHRLRCEIDAKKCNQWMIQYSESSVNEIISIIKQKQLCLAHSNL